jgi:hypothetical protein
LCVLYVRDVRGRGRIRGVNSGGSSSSMETRRYACSDRCTATLPAARRADRHPPPDRAAKVTDTGITWNYTTILNIIFLLLAAALLVRFVRSGGAPMLKMMGGSPAEYQHYADRSSPPQPQRNAQPAYQSTGGQ